MKNMDDNEFGGNRFLFNGNRDDDNDHLSNSDSDTDDSADSSSSVFRTFMGGSGDEPRLFGSDDSHTDSSEASDPAESVPHLNYKPEDLEFDETYPLTLDKPIFKRLEPETDEVSTPQPEESEPAFIQPEETPAFITQPEDTPPFYPQPEESEPAFIQPEETPTFITQPEDTPPFYPQPEEFEPAIIQPEEIPTFIPQPEDTPTFYPQPEESEPAFIQPEEIPTFIPQPEESVNEAESSFESPAYDMDASDYPSEDSFNSVEPVVGNDSQYSDDLYPVTDSDTVSGYENNDIQPKNTAGTDEFAEDDDEMSDTAFPLFLSFKANDSASSVSEAIRDKNTQKTSDNASRSSSGKASSAKAPIDDQTYNRMLNEAEPAIFKPYDAREESREVSQEVYDIPSVEPQNTASIGNESPEPAAFKPMFKQQDGRPAYPSRSVPAKPEVTEAEDTDDSDKTVRPGTRYYPAAQQMGYAAPMPQRELNKKRKKKKHGALIFTLTVATVLVAAFFIWNKYDIGNMLANRGKQITATVATTSAASIETTTAAVVAETTAAPTVTVSPTPAKVSVTPAAVVSVTATPTPKATATPTPKATATPTPKATATPTPKPTATPTPKPTATPTPASGESAKIPSGFSTSITDGSANGDTATFNIQFKNLSKTDVSLFDGVEYITITFNTVGAPVTGVTSDSFTFSPDPKHANTFIGIPTDKEVIEKNDTKTVGITGVSDGKDVGKYSIKYYVKTY